MLSKLVLLPIYKHSYIRRTTAVYKYVHGRRFLPASCYCSKFASQQRTSSRLYNQFAINVPIKTKFKRCHNCALYVCSNFFNNLPNELVQLPISQFKKSLLSYSGSDAAKQLYQLIAV